MLDILAQAERLANEECRFELGLGWFGGYDSYDLAALSLLSHGPPVRYTYVRFYKSMG